MRHPEVGLRWVVGDSILWELPNSDDCVLRVSTRLDVCACIGSGAARRRRRQPASPSLLRVFLKVSWIRLSLRVSDGSITSGISRLEVISSDGGRPSINAVIDALFIAVSVMVVFALVWGIYVIYLFQ